MCQLLLCAMVCTYKEKEDQNLLQLILFADKISNFINLCIVYFPTF